MIDKDLKEVGKKWHLQGRLFFENLNSRHVQKSGILISKIIDERNF